MRTSLLLSILLCVACGGSSPHGADMAESQATYFDLAGIDLTTRVSVDLAQHPVTPDGATPSDMAVSTAAQVNMTFSGCSPDFNTTLIVVADDESMEVSRSDSPLGGALQLHFTEAAGSTVKLSTMERVNTGDVVNLIVDDTYTNDNLGDAESPDPIAGTVLINKYDESAGIADLVFTGVVLNDDLGDLCTMSGTVKTQGLSF